MLLMNQHFQRNSMLQNIAQDYTRIASSTNSKDYIDEETNQINQILFYLKEYILITEVTSELKPAFHDRMKKGQSKYLVVR